MIIKFTLGRAGFVSLFLLQSLLVLGQLDLHDCPKYLIKEKRFLKGTIFRSDSSLTLKVNEELTGKLEINNGGLYKAVNFDFTFKIKTSSGSGIGSTIGELLVIYFRDHTKDEVYIRSRKPYSGKGTFAIVRLTDTRLGPELTKEDEIFFEKMKMVTISHLEITLNAEKHKIHLNAKQADWLRSVITCLGALKPY